MSNERRLKAYALVLATFLLGAATGAGVAYASLQHHYARIFRDHPDMMDNRRFGALARKLDLDDQQRERVHGIMQRYAEDRRNLMREMFAQCGDKVRAAQDKLDGDMKATLRPDQLSRYEAIAKERRDRFGFGRK